MRRNPLFNPYKWSLLASTFAFLAALARIGTPGASAADTGRAALEQQFNTVVRPFLQANCDSCHGKTRPQAQLDLTAFTTLASVAQDDPHWNLILERVSAKQMPPTNAKQPSDKQREAFLAWIRAARQFEANRNAGDPGPVLARRLSNSEYDYTIATSPA